MSYYKKISTILPDSLSGNYKVRNFKLRTLKNKYYTVVRDYSITGEAPKEFIRVYDERFSKKSRIKSWPLFIAKTGKKWYPIESVVEHINNEIGRILGFNMASSQLVIENGQLRFLSKYFLNRYESLDHGANIISGYLEDVEFFNQIERESKEKEFFTIQTIKEALEFKYPLCFRDLFYEYLKMLLFDAFLGINDRHFYNWGVISSIKDSSGTRFSPIFDSARSMFWNYSDEKINFLMNQKDLIERLYRYAIKSLPKAGIEDQDSINHFEVVRYIFEREPALRCFILNLYTRDNFEMVKSFIYKEFGHILKKNRQDLMFKYLDIRLQILEEILNQVKAQ